MALADIISKIESDAAAEAKRIKAAGKERADAVRRQADEAAAADRETVLAAAERDAAREASRIVSAARLQARDASVSKRRELLDEALAATAASIAKLPEDRYPGFLAEKIAQVASGGEELRLGSADKGRENAVVAALAKVSPQLALEVSAEAAPFERGALISGDRVSADLSLEAIVEEQRDELELAISSVLFGEEG